MSVKRIILVVLTIAMAFSSVSFAAVVDNQSVEPMYAIDLDVAPMLNFQGDTANCRLDLIASPSDADRAIVRIVLEKQNGASYTVVKTWRDQSLTLNDTGKWRMDGNT